jgi:hypothetical protein
VLALEESAAAEPEGLADAAEGVLDCPIHGLGADIEEAGQEPGKQLLKVRTGFATDAWPGGFRSHLAEMIVLKK